MKKSSFIAGLWLLGSLTGVQAQQFPPVDGRQFPLNQMSPPGTAAQWAVNAGRVAPFSFQPIRVLLPAAGQVTCFESLDRPVELPEARGGLMVGRMYRLRISGLEDFAGVEFFPSIELVDRLHPPAGREGDFPMEIEFTIEELEWAANGRLVTKVIYLEQPDRVPTTLLDRDRMARIVTLEPSRNILAEADSLGRPMAIVRLGGRTPDPLRPDPGFFGPGGPVLRPVIKDQAQARQPVEGVVRLNRSPRSEGVQPASHQPDCPPFSIQQCPPEPRWAAPGQNPLALGMVGCPCEYTTLAEKFPDEYLCDGGDRSLPVHYDTFMRHGLDTEDTVIEYTDHTGRERMKPSNRVCVYAPRFSTVRTVSQPHEGMNLYEVARVGQSVGSNQFRSRLKPGHHTRNEMTGGVRVRSRPSGLDSEQYAGGVSTTRRLVIHEKLINVYQDLNFVQFGKIETADTARLNFGLQAALIWSREQYPVIAGKIDAAMTGVSEAHAATIVGIDDEKQNEPGKLRIVKLADKQSAASGDVVEFTLRYDNLGPNAVYHVRIVDNLTPRLAYVDDSATSDREGRLVVQDNGEGSLVLIWELTQPLQPNTGGVVSFKARIR